MFENIKKRYKYDDFYFLKQQLSFSKKNPTRLKDIKILHNAPLFENTLFKIEALLEMGAHLVVSSPFGPGDETAIQELTKLKIPIIRNQDFNQYGPYDLILDTAALCLNKTEAKIGTVELTQTGANKYRQAKLSSPVISVDDSQLKIIEDFYGTGDGYVRAIKKYCDNSISSFRFLLFGYGKVGAGIYHYLKKEKLHCTVVEKCPDRLAELQKQKIPHIKCSQLKALKEHLLKSTDIVVTATGSKNILSKMQLNKEDFSKVKYLTNMGADDEYGKLFNASEVLFNKLPLNFALKEPTLAAYIDPPMYAHNLSAELLLYDARFKKIGFYPFPEELDQAIVKKWSELQNINFKAALPSLAPDNSRKN